jgi:cell division cycle protein 20 (cofactor of APC complex)
MSEAIAFMEATSMDWRDTGKLVSRAQRKRREREAAAAAAAAAAKKAAKKAPASAEGEQKTSCAGGTPKRTPKRSCGTKRGRQTPSSSKRSSKRPARDRMIPSRTSIDWEGGALYHLSRGNGENDNPEGGRGGSEETKADGSGSGGGGGRSRGVVAGDAAADSPKTKKYKDAQREILGKARGHRVLGFREKAVVPLEQQQQRAVLYSQNRAEAGRRVARGKVTRKIASQPERILDAPDLKDDYYLNLLDWSAQNVLAVALGPTVYLWNATDGSINELLTLENEDVDYVSSVSWVPGDGNFLAVGGSDSVVQLWDVNKGKKLRSMDGHQARVSSMSWNKHILSSGSRDNTIINHDVRIRQHKTATLKGHKGEVCGMKWSPDGATLASGGNDNMLCLWDHRMSATAGSGDPSSHSIYAPRLELNEHQAAVKALAWAPFKRNLLASGGGTADRCIKFWNTDNGSRLNSIDTGSQVCSLMWSPNHKDKEILSSHGYSENQLCLWKYPTMQKIKELNGHSARVLHLAQAPDGVTVCSAAADETLRFWRVFSEQTKGKSAQARGILNNMRSIR